MSKEYVYEGDKLGRIISAERNSQAAIETARIVSVQMEDLLKRVSRLEQENVRLKERDNELQLNLARFVSNGSTNGS